MNGTGKMIGVCAAFAALLCMDCAEGASILHKKNGQALEARTIRWRALTKEYQLEFDDGSMVPVPLADVESVEVDKPADIGKAEKLISEKNYDAAIPILEGVASQYAMLQWDAAAREMLANLYCAKGDYKKGLQALEDYFAKSSKDLAPDDLRNMYWVALLGAQRNATLKAELEEAIKAGSKTLVPIAMTRRGDLARAEGRREDAFLDYMRVVLVYSPAKELHPEALSKAAQVLDATNDRRADELRKRLAREFPDSPYARRSGGGL